MTLTEYIVSQGKDPSSMDIATKSDWARRWIAATAKPDVAPTGPTYGETLSKWYPGITGAARKVSNFFSTGWTVLKVTAVVSAVVVAVIGAGYVYRAWKR